MRHSPRYTSPTQATAHTHEHWGLQLVCTGLLVLLGFGLSLAPIRLAAQGDSTALFGPPMDIPLRLSGNFGEVRRNHFHTGIDIKTQGVQGKNILAIADGYVSRVRVSTTGYGLALYIDHPSGHTSVYAHLREFNKVISDYVRHVQYAEERWMIDHYPEAGVLKVERGEIVALSGNSGSSSGPHLHFEIRDTESEHPLNALDLGYDLDDPSAPIIQGVRVYPLSDGATVDGQRDAQNYTVRPDADLLRTKQDTIVVAGEFGLGLHTFDKMGADHHKYGVYRLAMDVDGETRYAHVMKELSFETFRYVNTQCDYGLYKKNKWRYHKCFLSANNKLDIYEVMVDRGKMTLAPGEVRHVLFRATDIKGNEQALMAVLKGAEPESEPPVRPSGLELLALSDNVYRSPEFVLQVPAEAIYDDAYLPYSVTDAGANMLSRTHRLSGPLLPIQEPVTIKIRPTRAYADSSKLVIVETSGRSKILGGEYRNGWIQTKVKSWGDFSVMEDLRAPVISGISGQNSASGRLDITATDDLSGIDDLRVEIDGRWLLMKHNRAKTKAWGDINDLDLGPGEHKMTITVRDAVGNEVVEERMVSGR